jgi:hypothetical protein
MTLYEIRVKEQLGQQWSDWFGGLTVTNEANGETVLTGEVIDQAALHGLLSKVRSLQLTLLSLRPVETDCLAQRRRKEQTEGASYRKMR